MYFIGNNKLYCQGWFVFGPKPYASLVTLLIINIPCVVFSIFTSEVSSTGNNLIVLLEIKYWVESCTMHTLVFTSGYEFITYQDSKHRPRNNPSKKMANQTTSKVLRTIKNQLPPSSITLITSHLPIQVL